MKFKLDENFGRHTQHIFRDAGHDVATVRDEGLQGSANLQIYEVCRSENRCLVTLDLDFADVIRFPPEQTAGIAVIRNPSLVHCQANYGCVYGLKAKGNFRSSFESRLPALGLSRFIGIYRGCIGEERNRCCNNSQTYLTEY